MSKKAEKTNVQYLRGIIEREHPSEEISEFLDAIENEIEARDKKIEEYRGEVKTADEEIHSLNIQLSEALEEPSYSNEIKTGMEPLNWDCNNIAIQSLMETFGDKLSKLGHIQLEAALSTL